MPDLVYHTDHTLFINLSSRSIKTAKKLVNSPGLFTHHPNLALLGPGALLGGREGAPWLWEHVQPGPATQPIIMLGKTGVRLARVRPHTHRQSLAGVVHHGQEGGPVTGWTVGTLD